MKIVYDGPTWNMARRMLKEKFQKVGLLDICEVGYDGICDNYHLTFAHSLRRNYIGTKEQMEEVVRACQKCHAVLDAKKHDVTYNEVRQIIARRILAVESIYDEETTDPRRIQSLKESITSKSQATKKSLSDRLPRKRVRNGTPRKSGKNLSGK